MSAAVGPRLVRASLQVHSCSRAPFATLLFAMVKHLPSARTVPSERHRPDLGRPVVTGVHLDLGAIGGVGVRDMQTLALVAGDASGRCRLAAPGPHRQQRVGRPPRRPPPPAGGAPLSPVPVEPCPSVGGAFPTVEAPSMSSAGPAGVGLGSSIVVGRGVGQRRRARCGRKGERRVVGADVGGEDAQAEQ